MAVELRHDARGGVARGDGSDRSAPTGGRAAAPDSPDVRFAVEQLTLRDSQGQNLQALLDAAALQNLARRDARPLARLEPNVVAVAGELAARLLRLAAAEHRVPDSARAPAADAERVEQQPAAGAESVAQILGEEGVREALLLRRQGHLVAARGMRKCGTNETDAWLAECSGNGKVGWEAEPWLFIGKASARAVWARHVGCACKGTKAARISLFIFDEASRRTNENE
jgi:hypothetical protein